MRLDDWRREERGERVATSMRVRWDGGDLRSTIAVPAALAGPEADASPFVAALLLLAMTVREDLETDALVSPLLRRGLERVTATLTGWDPQLRPAAVRDGGALPAPAAPPTGVAGLLSRGVDSLFTAAAERVEHPLTMLVHWHGLEPVHGPATRAAEEEACRAIADRVGLPLVAGENDLRAALDRHTLYHDSHGGALAGLGLALAGGVGRVVIPSTDSARTLGPMGSSPVLDGLLSSEHVRVEHDYSGAGRMGKVAALATQRPDLLPFLKVCFHEDRPDNCGRCGKCIETMCALVAVGALEQATGFPALDLGLVRAQRPSPLRSKHAWSEVALALGTTGRQGELRRAMEHALRRAARPGRERRLEYLRARVRGERPLAHPAWRAPERGFDWAAQGRTAMALLPGRPEARPLAASQPQPWFTMRGAEAPDAVGLLRAVDARTRRHRYAAGARPAGAPAGELGGLLAADPGDGVPLRLTDDGVPVHPPLPAGTGAPGRLSWALAPVRFADVPPAARLRAVAARARDLATARRRVPGSDGAVAGWLLPAAGAGRVPLLLADHPVLPDRLLTTRPAEAADLGYGEPVLLGHLLAVAPVTGTLVPPPSDVPWAHRFGLARRPPWWR